MDDFSSARDAGPLSRRQTHHSPLKGQAVIESLIEALRDLFEPIVGKKAFPLAFPILVTFSSSSFSIIGWVSFPVLGPWGGDDGRRRSLPYHPPAHSPAQLRLQRHDRARPDFIWSVANHCFQNRRHQAHPLGSLRKQSREKETPGWLYPILALVFFIVGFIEVFSIVIRPFTLSVRLFGNVFGGENLLHGTGFFFVFYFMELLVGLIQALVFTLLTSVYIGLLCNHGDDHDEHAHDDKSDHAAEAHH